jgi:hypothetical protein
MVDLLAMALANNRSRVPPAEGTPRRRRGPVIGPGGAGPGPLAGPVGVGAVIAPPTGQGRGAEQGDAGRQERLRRDAQDIGAAAGRFARRAANRPQTGSAAPAPRYPIGPAGVTGPDPITEASAATGVPAHYLSTLIGSESGGDVSAKADTSSATGAAQFIDSTWLEMMKRYGPRYGLKPNLDRNTVLDLRHDPRWSALMAAHSAQENSGQLSAMLGRPVRQGEVYLAHVFGPREAASLIRAAQRDTSLDPGGRPARDFVRPEAVAANHAIFYDGRRPRGAREVVARLAKNFTNGAF